MDILSANMDDVERDFVLFVIVFGLINSSCPYALCY